MVTELEEVPMSIAGGLDIHRKQLTFDWVDEQNEKWERGRISPADREHLADWLTRFDPATGGPVAFAMEGCTGWRYIAEEMNRAGVTAHLAEPAETSALRGPKRRAKTDLLTELRRGSGCSGRQMLIGVSRFSGRDGRRGRGARSVPVGGCSAWVIGGHRGSVRAVSAR
jgi:hypothetical protein